MNALLVISGLGVISLIAEVARFKRWLTAVVFAGLSVAMILVAREIALGATTLYFNNMMLFDPLALGFTALIVVVSIFWFWMAEGYFAGEAHRTDRASLVLFVITGAVIMSAFNNMSMLFLGIEILSISLYVLAGSKKESMASTEAAFKYFLMGSFATGFLLFGIALVYGATGSFHLDVISAHVATRQAELPGFFYLGVLLMLTGLAFKISAVPFHFWAPDVYDGSPTSVTAFMSTVVKIAAIAAFYRIFASSFASVQSVWEGVVKVMMVLTLIIPNLTALYQSNIKKMLAYSSVGHVGYLLLAMVAGNEKTGAIVFYYLAAYAAASLTAFAVLGTVEHLSGTTLINGFKGLFKRSPILAVSMTAALMSLAGIPPLAGFFGKYMVFTAAVEQGYIPFVILGVAASLVGVYYYFRVIVAMFFEPPQGDPAALPLRTQVLLVLLVAAVVAIGMFPDLLWL